MNSPWLQIRSNAPGLPGPFLQEHRDAFGEFRTVTQMVMTVRASVVKRGSLDLVPLSEDARHGVWLERLNNSTAIAHSNLHLCLSPERIRGGPAPGHLTQHHLRGLSGHTPAQIANRLYGEVLFPLSSVIILFADDFGSLAASARALANWMRFAPLVEIGQPPRLLVSTRDVTLRVKDFCDQLTVEMIQTLREATPGSSYSYVQARKAWERRVESVDITTYLEDQKWNLVSPHLDRISWLRKQCNHCFSAPHFQQLLQQAISSFAYRDGKPLDILRTLGIRDIAAGHARVYVQDLLRAQFREPVDRTTIIASCIAMNTYSPASHGFHPEKVFQTLVAEFIDNIEREERIPELASDVRRDFYHIVGRHLRGESIMCQHLSLVRRLRTTLLPGCNVCLLKVPIHRLTCQHRFCGSCLTQLWPQLPVLRCPLCDKSNWEDVLVKPATAGIRALVLTGSSPAATLKFLASLRRTLFGHLENYFDIVVASEEVASIVIDYFCHRHSLPSCSRRLAQYQKRKWSEWQDRTIAEIPGSRICIAVLDGGRFLNNYSSHRLLKPKSGVDMLLSRLHLVHSRRTEKVNVQEHVEAECVAIWGSGSWIRVEHDEERKLDDGETLARRLIASLFYVELILPPDFRSSPFICQLEVKCRLFPGYHLNALVRMLWERAAQLGCKGWGRCIQSTLCDSSDWQHVKAGGEFSRKVEIEVLSVESELLIQIDGHEVSNCPYRLKDLIHDDASDLRESTSESTTQICSSPVADPVNSSATIVNSGDHGNCVDIGSEEVDSAEENEHSGETREDSVDLGDKEIDIKFNEELQKLEVFLLQIEADLWRKR